MLPVSVLLEIVDLDNKSKEGVVEFSNTVSYVKTLWELLDKKFILGFGNSEDTLSVFRRACKNDCFFYETKSFSELLSLIEKYNGRVSFIVIDGTDLSSYDLNRFIDKVEESKVKVVLLNPRIIKSELYSIGDRVEVAYKPVSEDSIRDLLYI